MLGYYHKSQLIYGGSVQQKLSLPQLSYSVCINWLTAIVLILAQETCGLLQVLPHGQGYITPYGVCCWAQEDLSYGIQHGA
ncbi:putative incI1 conjugal transfer protein PilU [Escherichia coli MP020980.2]|nr:putative incI1 conjugal transfer protein PilU [Escherichia coli MP020980.2]ENA00632.1 putative incI1 conjugal transfer protein PilU [Escherichia coli P0299917.1]ENF42018.1 putative incI1 conjugal transfer protein PilU [Escherichia coli P0304816.14]ENF58569.1 putative incI1 conjugal transfer protein PilU [Escherichia coli P0304816.7]